MKYKVAIICCSFNLAKYIQSTMDSIVRQTEKSKQIIVADAASTDNTLDILSRFNHIEVSTKSDSGYVEGFWNGVALVRADYLTQCCISDGYIDEEWLQIACQELDENPELSLVWGSPIYLNADETLGEISFPKFKLDTLPLDFDMRHFWMLTGFHFPEGNFVARKEVFLSCFPSLEEYKCDVMEPYLEFSYRFHKSKFTSLRIPRVANYGRVHEGQLTQVEIETSKKWLYQQRYQAQILEIITSDISLFGIVHNFRNFPLYIAAYFGAQSRKANAKYHLELKIFPKLFLALLIRVLSLLARVFTPRLYKAYI